MDISPELKKRFAQDCCIPIDIFTEPTFTSRIQLFDRFYNTIERYNVFLDMLKTRYTTYDMESTIQVTTHRKGTTSVVVMSEADPKTQKECVIKVIDNTDQGIVESIELDKTEIYLSVGSSKQLYATILPETLEDKRILWGTSDKSLATVSGGVVTAVSNTAAGQTCTITAMSNKDKSKIATCVVHITDTVELSGLDFTYHQTELEIGESERLEVNAVPANATSTALVWESSNPSVASVQDGLVTALSTGSCGITAKYERSTDKEGEFSLQDTCYVLVHNKVPVSQILLEKSSMTMIVGGMTRLNYEILPEKATNKAVIWSSSNENVLKVDPTTGMITAVGRGGAYVILTSEVTSYKFAQCYVEVRPSLFVRDLQIDPASKEIGKNEQFDIKVTLSAGYDVCPCVFAVSKDEMLVTVQDKDEIAAPTQTSAVVHAQDYYNDCGQVKSKIVRHIKSSGGYSRFVTLDVETSWPVNCTCQNGTIYTKDMDGHTMISIKLDKPMFSPMYIFDSSIFNNLTSWEDVVSTIGETDNDHIIYSENMLKDVMNCCNASRVEAYGRYLLYQFYANRVLSLLNALKNDSKNPAKVDLVYFGTDEMVIDTSALTQIIDLDASNDKVLCSNRLIKLFNDIVGQSSNFVINGKRVPFVTRLFTLYKLKTEYEDTEGNTVIDDSEISGFVRNIYFEGNQPLEFEAYDICMLPMLMRAMSYQEIQEEDRKFLHEGLVAQFTDDHKIHVPAISTIPDTSKDCSSCNSSDGAGSCNVC